MDYYSVWPTFVAIALLLLLASTPLFKAADTPPNFVRSRISVLDGLRGFLAYAVFFGHAAAYHRYVFDGVWRGTRPFYNFGAEAAVALFFMITGYLFWGKLLSEGGRPNWVGLYLGRIFRIGPLYIVAIVGMFLVVLLRTRLQANEPTRLLIGEGATWGALGINRSQPDVNGYHNTTMILLNVTWSLFFEWRFYASLILLAVVARYPKAQLSAVLIALVACLTHMFARQKNGMVTEVLASLFLFGMLAASLERRRLLAPGNQIVKSLGLLIALALFGAFGLTAYNPLSAIFLGTAFYFIISGANPFGLLTCTPARRLGDVSFGIYLLQGLVLTTVYSFGIVRTIELSSPTGHWQRL